MSHNEDAHESRLRRIRESGNRLTHARTVVLRALESYTSGHPTSSEVLEIVHEIDESVGRASVFRTLDLFTQLSIIRPTYVTTGAPQYVLMPDGHHHHIVCLNCNRTIEFEDCNLGSLQEELQQRLNVQLIGHLLEFYGICESCQ
ncbi:MAG: Fur family transcriptional regulator [Chloroflexota bacterium]